MKHLYLGALILPLFTSCWAPSTNLVANSVAYQSIRTRHAQPTASNPIPDDAKIIVAYSISCNGELTATVFNKSSDVLTIDQTMSFFVNSDGTSTSYFDPTVRTTSVTDMSSSSTGASLNLGAVTGAIGIGGAVGKLANGINVGGSQTQGTSVTNTTYIADQPKVSIAPHGSGTMSKIFRVIGIGQNWLIGKSVSLPEIDESQSYCTFSVCISYSLDGGNTFEKLISNFYANSKIIVPVNKNGKVNDALRTIYTTKPDAINEHWWVMNFDSNCTSNYKFYENEKMTGHLLYDYQ